MATLISMSSISRSDRRFSDRQSVVVVDAEDGLRTQCLTELVEPVGGWPDALPRFKDPFTGLIHLVGCMHAGANDVPPLRHEHLGLFDQAWPHRRLGRGEHVAPIAMLAAEQLVDRYPKRLALDVVEGDIDCGDGCGEDASAFEVLAPVEVLPDGTDVEWVLPDDQFSVMP